MYHLNLSKNGLDGAVPFDGAFLRRLGRNLDLSGNPGLCVDDDRSVVKDVGVGSCRGAHGYDDDTSAAVAVVRATRGDVTRSHGDAPWSALLRPSASVLLCCLLL
jgi:hypothetical protein